jgi:hypothetical protein
MKKICLVTFLFLFSLAFADFIGYCNNACKNYYDNETCLKICTGITTEEFSNICIKKCEEKNMGDCNLICSMAKLDAKKKIDCFNSCVENESEEKCSEICEFSYYFKMLGIPEIKEKISQEIEEIKNIASGIGIKEVNNTQILIVNASEVKDNIVSLPIKGSDASVVADLTIKVKSITPNEFSVEESEINVKEKTFEPKELKGETVSIANYEKPKVSISIDLKEIPEEISNSTIDLRDSLISKDKLNEIKNVLREKNLTINDIGVIFEVSKNKIDDESIKKVIIEIKVDKSWVEKYGKDSVLMIRESSGKYTILPVTFIKEEGNYYIFQVESPGFSMYALVTVGYMTPKEETIPPVKSEGITSSSITAILIIIAIIIIGVIYLFSKRSNK